MILSQHAHANQLITWDFTHDLDHIWSCYDMHMQQVFCAYTHTLSDFGASWRNSGAKLLMWWPERYLVSVCMQHVCMYVFIQESQALSCSGYGWRDICGHSTHTHTHTHTHTRISQVLQGFEAAEWARNKRTWLKGAPRQVPASRSNH